jgi:hypothetical protein
MSGASLTAAIALGNWVFLGFAGAASGYFAHRAYRIFGVLKEHSILQNRAVNLLQRQLTSEED